jgi:GntR family transcriptional regulator
LSEQVVLVDPQSPIPAYMQILEQLRGAIAGGALRPDDRLPTVRQLAGDLNIAPNTVARAYQELQEEGWLVGDGRRGTRVAANPKVSDKRTRNAHLRDAVQSFVDGLVSRGYSSIEIADALSRSRRD